VRGLSDKGIQSIVDIKGRKIIFNGVVYTVLKRKNEIDRKPLYYLFDLENKVYLSSLYGTGEANTYLFDVKGEGKYLLRFSDDLQGYEIERIE
jgi:cytoplasmic iron level regulating protein YaaA (DUF328/UPF0246 family)